ncbi:MAG: SGNH/GDSL hydrolase family protein [Mastigocoleus sp.]
MKIFIPKYLILVYIFAGFSVFEIVLRLTFGLGNPPLFQADSDTGYRFQPNQKLTRFGKKIQYNQYSQRSESITLNKPQKGLRIMIVGDSVSNGGAITDQSKIISEQLKDKLNTKANKLEVLNASTGSWGIGNQLGYIRKFGTFQSDLIIIQIGSHDLMQPTSTDKNLGKPYTPIHNPALATQELIIRYILPRLSILKFIDKNSNPNSNSNISIPKGGITKSNEQFKQNMDYLREIISLIRSKKIPILVLFTPDKIDLIPTFRTPIYKSEFLQIIKQLKVPIVDTHLAWSKLPKITVESHYRDFIHFNERGNLAVADLLSKEICIKDKFKICSES